VIKSAAENKAANAACLAGGLDRSCWIGLVQVEGAASSAGWSWTDGTTPSYANWHTGQPDGIHEQHTMMNLVHPSFDNVVTGVWYDTIGTESYQYGLCERSQIVPSPTVKDAPPAVYASLALRGSADLIIHQVRAALRFLGADAVVVHVSKGSYLPPRLHEHERVLINPHQYQVEAATPSILGVHISNTFVLMSSQEGLDDYDKLVILSANSFLFRPCSLHLRSATISFMLGEATDITFDLANGVLTRQPMAYPHSEEWRAMGRKVAAGNDSFLRSRSAFRMFRNYMAGQKRALIEKDHWPTPAEGPEHTNKMNGMEDAWRAGPLTHMPHEGSFYPLWLLKRFIAFISTSTSVFSPAAMVNGSECAFTKWFGCMYEELLLPTYVWQKVRAC
jgi:hypothetical protein